MLKAGVHLNGIFAPLNTGLVQISRWNFKHLQKRFLGIFGYIWVEIVFLKGLEKFRQIRKIEDLMKFKN